MQPVDMTQLGFRAYLLKRQEGKRSMDHRVCVVTLSIALLSAWSAVIQPSRAQEVIVPDGFVTGESYIRMDERARSQYVMGLFDGLMTGGFYGASQRQIKELKQCNIGRNSVQLAEILYRYTNEHPEDWHLGANISFYRKMIELCPRIGST